MRNDLLMGLAIQNCLSRRTAASDNATLVLHRGGWTDCRVRKSTLQNSTCFETSANPSGTITGCQCTLRKIVEIAAIVLGRSQVNESRLFDQLA